MRSVIRRFVPVAVRSRVYKFRQRHWGTPPIGAITTSFSEAESGRPSFLILDRVPERGPAIDTEGAKLFLSLRRKGAKVTLTGPGYTKDLRHIPELATDFDICLLCDNYPSDWSWNAFERIRIPKLFWAIDSHHQDFPFVVHGDFQHVLFNNHAHIDEFMSQPEWETQLSGHSFFPYAFEHTLAAGWHGEAYLRSSVEEKYDLVFCGSLNQDRADKIRLFEKVSGRNVVMLTGFGQKYVDNILSGRLQLNLPVLSDFNARHMDVLGLGRMLLTPFQLNSIPVIPETFEIYFHSFHALNEKIAWLLADEAARHDLASRLRRFILDNHTYDHRAETLIELARASHL